MVGDIIADSRTTSPGIRIETRHAQRSLSSGPVKPTKNDARGIAEMMRLGHYRPVICAQNDRHWMEHWPRRPDIGRRLMTIPGVGPVTTLAYIAAVDDPGRF